MRLTYTIIFVLLIIILTNCAFVSRKSSKSIGNAVFWLVTSFIIPLLGNLIIIFSSKEKLSTVGYYIYFLGMDCVVMALMRYSFKYCNIERKLKKAYYIVYALVSIDLIQYIFNPFFHNAFTTEPITVDHRVYYSLNALLGQTYHRIVCYGILLVAIIIFSVKTFTSPKIYVERYAIILFALIIGSLWETYYIFSRIPVDRSMIGFAAFAVLVFYFSLYYRPMRLLDQMLANVVSEMSDAIYFFDGNRNCVWVNEPGKLLLDLGGTNFDSVPSRLKNMFGDRDWISDDWSDRAVIDYKNIYDKDPEHGSEKKYYYLEKHKVENDRGHRVGAFISIRDITEEQLALEKERYNATHDALTEMYTKEYLFQLFRKMLDENPDTDYYVVYGNINDFKIVNDIFGNEFGDFVLKYIASIIQFQVQDKGICGRLVGDTFGICIPVDKFDEESFEKELTHFTVSDGTVEHYILMHLGVYKVIKRELEVSYMFDRARMALSTIKNDYKTYIAFYDDKMRDDVLWEQHITTDLADALKNNQIVPFLQPIVNAEQKVVGAEALVRWLHPEDGFLAPYRFIPIFEKNGMIAEVDKHMWEAACQLLSKWKKSGKELFISINISPKDFYFMNVYEVIKEITTRYDIDPKMLRIEITETMMMNDAEKRFDIIRHFREDGFTVEMDDFGSGYSSLNMLKDMPVDLIKIDMAFLRKTKDSEMQKAMVIVHHVIRMLNELGLVSLTEGVEEEKQFSQLSSMGCSLFQGYYFSKPMPVKEFEDKYL